jgi:hypothetical protein
MSLVSGCTLCRYVEPGCVCAQGRWVCISLHELSSLTRLTQLRISTPDDDMNDGSPQCLSALRRLQDLDIGDLGRGDKMGLATAPHCTALTRLKWLCVPTQVHIRDWHRTHTPAGSWFCCQACQLMCICP